MPKAKTSAPKKSAPKAKKSQPKVVEPVVETPVVDTPVVDTPSVNTEGNNVAAAPQMLDYDAELLVLENQLRDAMTLVKSAMSGLTAHKRKVARERKVVEKKMRVKVKRVKDPNAPPSGFEKPLEVSKELHKFLSLPDGELIARTSVTRAITAYCKKHDLQNPNDKRQIKADKTLIKLLRLSKEDTLTFFNLQKFLKPHYPNKEGVIEA
jgi:hypothetical protein